MAYPQNPQQPGQPPQYVPPGAGAPQYQAPQPGYGYQQPGYGAARPNAPSAMTALITGLIGILVCAPVGIAGIIYGKKAKDEIRASGGMYDGDGLATAGLVMGWISVVLFVLTLVWILFILLAASSNAA